jgi:protein-S-isoprenylcysteine O-methyltransferase Ste14
MPPCSGLFFLGYALTGSSWLSYLGIGLYGVVVHFIVIIEERHLMVVYGEAYGQYRKTTPRYIGLPRKGKKNQAS